jgi:serine/threonine protein kinase
MTLSNNEIYGVVPYIAPEKFKGSSFSKESDVYSLGMIMWGLTTGRKPFADFEHDHILIYKILDGDNLIEFGLGTGLRVWNRFHLFSDDSVQSGFIISKPVCV